MKKIISLILAILMITTFVPLTFAGATETIYISGTNVSYEIENNVVTLHCSDENGVMTDFSYWYGNWNSPFAKNKTITEMIFDEGITHISAGLAGYCSVSKVTFPSTLKDIGEYAFNDTSVAAIVLPEGLEKVGEGAFYCAPCTELVIPSTLKRVDYEGLYFRNSAVKNLEIYTDISKIVSDLTHAGYGTGAILAGHEDSWLNFSIVNDATITICKQNIKSKWLNLSKDAVVNVEYGSTITTIDEEALKIIVNENIDDDYIIRDFWNCYNKGRFEDAWNMYLYSSGAEKPYKLVPLTKANAASVFGSAKVNFPECFIDENGNGELDDETQFRTVEAAISAEHSNESETNPTNIVFFDDVNVHLEIEEGRYINIDAKNYTITDDRPTSINYTYCYGCISNSGNLTIKNGTIKGCQSSESGAIYNHGSGVLNVSNFTFTNNTSSNNGGAVTSWGTATFTNCAFTNNIAPLNGGAISNSGSLLLRNCTVTNNTSSQCGGGVSSTGGTKCVLLNTTVTGNTATKFGDGVYYGDYVNCIVAGTKITMADGTTKNVEDVEVGDIVKTFDHENGTFSSAKVYFAYEDDSEAETFELAFDNGTKVECVTSYSFLEKTSRKYVELTNENATSHIGEYFYGEDGNWHRLENVTFGTTNNEYDIYTADCQNVIVNGMLSSPADVDYLLNIYELDENLKADATQLAADIEKYGIVSYEYASAMCDMDKEWYNDCSVKYVFVAIGKGTTTWEECFGTYASVGKLTSLDKFNNNVVTIGAGTKIYNNSKSNVYLEKNYYITIHGDITDTDTNVGVTLANATGQFTTNGTFEDIKYFTSDNEEYKVLHYYDDDENASYLEIENHTSCQLFVTYEENYVAPTCEKAGSIDIVHVCAECGREIFTMTKTKGEALGHNFYYPVKNDTLPTCTEDGHNNIYEACTRCDYYKIYEVETLPKTGHNLTDWTVVTKATCTTDGLKRRTCTKCNYDEEEVIKATGHSDVIAEFNRVNPTCSTVGGYDNYYVCATCHRNEFIEHITIEKLDCTAGEWEIVKEATEDEEGLRVKKCTGCGEIVVSETIEKLPKTEPETKEETTTETTTEHHHDDTDYSDICLICGNDHHGNLIQDFICLIVSVCRKIAAFFNGGTWGPGARFPLPVE